MGFFPKKKGAKDPQASPLSEAEIHRKLYGEFEADALHAVPVERDPFKESVSLTSSGKEARMSPPDLFSIPRDAVTEPETPSRPIRPVIKSPENPSRYVPLHEFEKKTGAASDPVDVYARFRSGASASKMKTKIFTALTGIFERGHKFLLGLMDPRRVMVRRVLYWSAAGFVVFLLFWGVNALNSQREVAMKTQYKRHKEPSPATLVAAKPVHEMETTPVAERPVVITPAPPRPREVVITPAATVKHKEVPVSSSGSYAIQVVTYPGLADAEKVVEALKREKLDAFLKEYNRPSGRVFYVVFIGGYRTEAEAQAQLEKFRAQEVARPFQDAFVKTI